MPASNRRPLWEPEDGPPPPPAQPASSHHAAAAEASSSHAGASPAAAHAGAASSSLAAPATQQPPAAPAAPAIAFKQPCTFKGAASALYAGLLGYFLGVVPAAIKFKGRQWGMAHAQGLGSARQLAIMSGLYTAVHCICQRIRLVEDGWNRGIAGCSTGLVLGWANGPWSAAQSCAGLGAISALVDLGGGAVEAAEAAVLHSLHDLQQAAVAVKQARAADLGCGGRGEEGQRPLPAHLAMLLLGLPPATIGGLLPARDNSSSSSRGAHDEASAPVASHKQQQQRLALPATASGHAQQQRQGQQQQQQQGQQLLRPAVHAVQQLLAVPPLMFLGACCQGETMAGRSSPGNALVLLAGDVDVEGCAVGGSGSSTRR